MSSAEYPSLHAYAFIGDGHTTALVSTSGCIDWCCMPRVDSPACFGRLLDWERGGHLTISPAGEDWSVRRRYLPDTLVLETTFETPSGSARILDCVAMRRGGRLRPYRQLLRVVEGMDGRVEMLVRIEPRLEYGGVRPRIRRVDGFVTAVGGSTGLLFSSDLYLEAGDHEVTARFAVEKDDRRRLSMQWHPPHVLDRPPGRRNGGVPSEGRPDVDGDEGPDLPGSTSPDEIDRRLEETIEWWRDWSGRLTDDGRLEPARRSARVLKALINPPTGAMVAAPTTSLPEIIGGERNWDYRYSWVRDSIFAVRALTRLGAHEEADGFRRFVERSAAGYADEVQIAYGVDGSIRLHEVPIELEGYRGSRPVRIGNAAFRQLQLDVFGYLLQLAWEWYRRGAQPDPDYGRFIVDTANLIARRWREPDRGIWEMRSERQHFVHSKVMCWVGLDRALKMADAPGFEKADVEWWSENRDELRETIESQGVRSGSFVRAFGEDETDAALLMLPLVGFVEADDPRMVSCVDRIVDELSMAGSSLIRRYVVPDGLAGQDWAFLPCSFWLAEVLLLMGRRDDAERVFEEAASTTNEMGLFSEEYDPGTGTLLGNYPQALTHLAHIDALCAIREEPRPL